MITRRTFLPFALAACAVVAALSPLHSAYRGHADNPDVAAVLSVYPALKGTPADSCAICHVSGVVRDQASSGGMRRVSHCDYCHAVFVRGKGDVRQTLNRFALDYLAAGGGAQAVRALAPKDSDGDGFTNETELQKGTNPGDAASSPSVPPAPSRAYTVATLRGLAPVLDLPVLVNTTKSRSGDAYNDYRGNSLWALLQAVGVSEMATSVDILSADGYEYTFTLDELKKSWPQGPPVMGLGRQELGACGWVSYASPRLEAGKPLPNAPVMFVFEENGKPLPKARFDRATGRIVGQGPVRVIAPQFRFSPPDLSQTADASCSEKVAPAYRFHEDYEHNGGSSAYGIVAVRATPLPKGTRDIDWQAAAARSLEIEEIVFFGALTAMSPSCVSAPLSIVDHTSTARAAPEVDLARAPGRARGGADELQKRARGLRHAPVAGLHDVE